MYLILLTPLLVWNGSIVPHLTAKALGFQILVEIISAAALIAVIMEGPGRSRKLSLLSSPVFSLTTLFLAYSLLSALLGVDRSRSLWGVWHRQDGLIMLMHFFAWTLAAAWFFMPSDAQPRPPSGAQIQSWRRASFHSYLLFSFVVCVAVTLTATWEAITSFDGIRHILQQLILPAKRLSGVFGNPVMLGPYLLFHFFIGVYLLISTRRVSGDRSAETRGVPIFKKALKYGFGAFLATGEVLILTVMAGGQTRGVILGWIVGGLCCGFLAPFGLSTGRHAKIIGPGALLCLAIAASGIWHYRNSEFIRRVPVLQRFVRASVSEDDSVFGRAVTWRAGLRSFWEHPISGWGINNAYYGFNKYYDPSLIRVSPLLEDTTETWFDKSHNSYIDMAVERGVIGILLYLILLWLIIRSLWRIADRRLGICMIGALLACQAANAVAFDTFGSYFAFFLILAYIGSHEDPVPIKFLNSLLKRGAPKTKADRMKARRTGVVPGICAVLVVLAGCLYMQTEIAAAQQGYIKAREGFAWDPAIGIYEYERAFQHFSPYHMSEKIQCVYFLIESITKKVKTSRPIDAGPFVRKLTREIIEEHPLDPQSYKILNQMYNLLSVTINIEFAREAEVFGRQAILLSPKRQEALYGLIRTYVILNQPLQAIELGKRMLRDADFALGHWGLGLSLLQNNQHEEARTEVKRALAMGYQMTPGESALLKQLMGDKEFLEMTAGK